MRVDRAGAGGTERERPPADKAQPRVIEVIPVEVVDRHLHRNRPHERVESDL